MEKDLIRRIEKDRIYIRPISPLDNEDVYSFLQTIEREEYEFHNDAYGLSYEEYEEWKMKQIDWSLGVNLPEGYVPQTVYLMFVDGIPVGLGKIRRGLTEQSREAGGNIGYAVGKKYRGKGYGKLLFSALIQLGKENGVKEMIATVRKPNYVSKHVIELCGGRLFRETEERWYYDVSGELN